LLNSCCTCWFTVTVVKLLFGNGRAGLGIRYDGIAAITAMITVHRAQQNMQHRQKSTSSRYYRLTRLHVRSIDSIDFKVYSRGDIPAFTPAKPLLDFATPRGCKAELA